MATKEKLSQQHSMMIGSNDTRIPEVSIIIVSYNTRKMTLDCIHSVVKQTVETSYELIFIDNASTDDSYATITEQYSDIVGIESKENLGFAQANNVAALKAKGKYLLLLNPDTLILDNAIDRLMDFARTAPEAKIWGGRTLYPDLSLNVKNCYRKMSLWSLFCRSFGLATVFSNNSFFNSEAYGGWDRGNVREVDIVVGCFLLTELSFWQKLDGFDSQFFMYGEEADLCLRAAKLGARPKVTPTATIVHYGGASETVRKDKMVRLFSSLVKLIRVHFDKKVIGAAIALFSLWPLTRMFSYKVATWFNAEKYVPKFQEWQSIWQARHIWLKRDA